MAIRIRPTPLRGPQPHWLKKPVRAVLRFFNASPDEYVVIFTANASGALKLVGEAYPFGKDCCYLLTFDNHNSVNGIREYALAKGARVHISAGYAPPPTRG